MNKGDVYMENKIIHGTHRIGNDHDGYMYSFNTSMGYTFDSHLHKCYEIIHVISGSMVYIVEESEYLVSDGDIIITAPNELHSFSFPKESEYQREFLHIYPGFIENMPEAVKMLSSRRSGSFNHIPADKVTKYGLDKIFEDMRITCENPAYETDLTVFADTLLLIARLHCILANDAPEYNKNIKTKSRMIYDYIDHHFAEDINTDSVARMLLMSSSGAERLFKRKTGMTIKAYTTFRRVSAAKNLMMEGQKAMNIYNRCGFHDYSTFYRAFVKYAGMTPDEFKHRHTDKENC